MGKHWYQHLMKFPFSFIFLQLVHPHNGKHTICRLLIWKSCTLSCSVLLLDQDSWRQQIGFSGNCLFFGYYWNTIELLFPADVLQTGACLMYHPRPKPYFPLTWEYLQFAKSNSSGAEFAEFRKCQRKSYPEFVPAVCTAV